MAWNVQVAQEQIAFLMEAGLIYRDARRFQEAEQVFTGVRSLAPTSDVPEVALGTLRFAQGNLEGAIRHYRTALQLNPRSAFAHVHLGEAHLFRKERDQAREHLKKAGEIDPRGEFGEMARSLMSYLDSGPKA